MPAPEIVAWAIEEFRDSFAIATSFQKEGMVLIDLAARVTGEFRVFSLDTGRLPDETYRMAETVRSRYGVAVEWVPPDPGEVQQLISLHSADLFRDSVDNRRLCCEVRKVRPLARQLAGLRAWAAGLRREQSPERSTIGKVEQEDGRLKINPLADWTAAEVEEYSRVHQVPVHPLYAAGYGTIGCAPCTRALLPGESGRDGRWWWERDASKECGIHFAPAGEVRRGPAAHDILTGDA